MPTASLDSPAEMEEKLLPMLLSFPVSFPKLTSPSPCVASSTDAANSVVRKQPFLLGGGRGGRQAYPVQAPETLIFNIPHILPLCPTYSHGVCAAGKVMSVVSDSV